MEDGLPFYDESRLGSLTPPIHLFPNRSFGLSCLVAAGPIGRTAEAGASASVKSVAAIYSYSKSKGLFAGNKRCFLKRTGRNILQGKQ